MPLLAFNRKDTARIRVANRLAAHPVAADFADFA
jgi:hypothetical protein